MANQIGPDNHNTSDWFRTKQTAREIDIIFINHAQQPIKK